MRTYSGLFWGFLRAYVSLFWLLTLICLIIFYLSGFYTCGRAYRSRYKALIVAQAVSLLNPISLYARTKIGSERVLLALNDDRFAPLILRFGTAYGLSPRPRFDLVINLLAARCAEVQRCYGAEEIPPCSLAP